MRDDEGPSDRSAGGEPPGCLVVMYHYVRPADAAGAIRLPALKLAEFETQLDRLAATREIISAQTYLGYLHQEADLPTRAALLTFDDGLSDHARYVFPALQRRGLSGAFFVQTDPVENRHVEAAHMSHLLLAALDFDELTARFESALDQHAPGKRLADFFRRDEALSLYDYETEGRALYKYALAFGLPFDLRDRILTELFRRWVGDPDEWARNLYPTWAQLAEMQNAGMHVGGHSHRHEVYTRLRPAQQADDAKTCWDILCHRLGRQRRAFAYPYGRYDAHAVEAVSSAGFAAALTTVRRTNLGRVPPYEIARVDCIHLDSFLEEPAVGAGHARA